MTNFLSLLELYIGEYWLYNVFKALTYTPFAAFISEGVGSRPPAT